MSLRTKALCFGGLCAVVFGLVQSAPARADAIDGDWCHSTQNLTIEGPMIKTPGGNRINGDYDRHGFRYVVPANEPGAGTEIVMQLRGDENMFLVRKIGATESPPENWKRCKPTS